VSPGFAGVPPVGRFCALVGVPRLRVTLVYPLVGASFLNWLKSSGLLLPRSQILRHS